VGVAVPPGGFDTRCPVPVPFRTEHPEMGVVEAVAVREAVALEPIQTDVGQPDQAEGQDERPVLPPPDTDHGAGRGVACAAL
jgi:hypothetical protein